MSRKEKHLRNLSRVGFTLWIDDDLRFVIVEGVLLPPGYDRNRIPVLIELPSNYPVTPPGVGDNRIYVPGSLRYGGRELEDIHEGSTPNVATPGWDDWAWMCYEEIEWEPCRDDLITLIETIRADLTDPELKIGAIRTMLGL